MGLRIKIYSFLVNLVPGIRSRYQNYRQTHDGIHRLFGWLYLLILNFRYHILRDKSLARPAPSHNADANIRLPENSESGTCKIDPPEQLAQRLCAADVISFDVFDTLILRPYRKPEDLFWDLELRLRYPGLKLLRQQAEQQARAEKKQTNEVTLREIWDKLSTLTGLSAEDGMQMEWCCELDACSANPYFLDVVHQLSQARKKMIICSDMYLSAEHIRKLLLHCGYPEFDSYFVSSDHQMSKSDGSLYDLMHASIGQDTRCIHVGDNPHSDFKQAKRKGFGAILYPNVHQAGAPWRAKDLSPLIGSIYSGIINTRLHNGTAQYSQAYELGYIYGGLFVTGYCQFIHQYVHSKGIQRILFLSRDGEILHKAYLQMYPQDAALCRYVWWSRLAATKLSARQFKAHYMTCMVGHKIDGKYSIEDVMNTMQLGDMLEEFQSFTQNQFSRDDRLSQKAADCLRRFLDTHWDQVCAHYDNEVQAGGDYFARQIGSADTAVAVDVGWVGSGPLLLRHMIENVWSINCKVTGIVAGTCGQLSPDAESSAAQRASGELVSYLFSDAHNRDLWKCHDPSLGHNLLLELILAATTPSFRGFSDANGGFQFSSQRESIDCAAIQQGILDFAEVFVRHPLGQLHISGADAMAPIRILTNNSEWVRKLISSSMINTNIE